jgi:CelD/BcsL family acetyltransferase involved in cellulose biosynthesis
MGAVNVREIRDVAEWDGCADDWRRITAESPRATVFQSWEWTRAWWDHFGGGARRLWVLAFVEDGTTVGFAPLFLPPIWTPLRTARFLGTGASDYGDLIALPEREDAVRAAFWGFLSEHRGRWDQLDLQQIRPEAVLAASEAALPQTVRVQIWPGENCPFLPLPGDWETFRKGLGKKLRGNIGYYERALAKVYEVEMRLATPESLGEDMAALFDLHQRRWNKRWMPGAFATRRARAFHRDVAARLLGAGFLRLHLVALDGETQAALYCYQFNRRCAYYQGGFEPSLARLSIGTVLTAHAIRHAIEADGAGEFDFLRGDEPYKYRWGARDRQNRRFSVTRRGLVRPRLLQSVGRWSHRAELAFKDWMHRRHGSPPAAVDSARPGVQH